MTLHDGGGPNGKNRRTFLKGVGASALVTMSGLTGCTEGGDGGSNGSGSGDDVLVGGIVPLSGGLSQLGESEERGIELAVDYINEELGGMAGRNVDLVMEDTAGDPETGLESARRLVEQDEVDVLAGGVSGAVAHSIAQYAYDERVPFWTYGGAKETTGEECTPTVFRVTSKTTQDARAGVQWSLDNLGTNVYIHYADYAYGQSIQDDWEQAINDAAMDTNIVDISSTPLGTTDFSSYISQIQASDADWVLVAVTGGDLIAFVQQAEQFGLMEEVELMSTNVTTKPIRQGIGSAGIGINGIIRYDATYDSPENELLNERHMAEYGEPADDTSMVMWTSLLMHTEAANAVDSVATEDIVPELEGLETSTAMGPMTMRECDHQAVRDIPIGRITEPDEYDWPSLETIATIPGDEAIEPCEETGCDMPSL